MNIKKLKKENLLAIIRLGWRGISGKDIVDYLVLL
jgi:hypothetical protein